MRFSASSTIIVVSSLAGDKRIGSPRPRLVGLGEPILLSPASVPNYEKSVTKVYQGTFIAFMKKRRPYENLNLLATCEMRESAQELSVMGARLVAREEMRAAHKPQRLRSHWLLEY